MAKLTCKACAAPITDKTRSKFCLEHRGPNTHQAKPTVRLFGSAAQ